MPGIIPPGFPVKTSYPVNAPKSTSTNTPANNPAPFTTDVMTGKPVDPAVTAKAQILAMQTFLNNRGYKIAMDGVRGPETNAAVLAFHNKVKPESFNSRGRPTTTVPHDTTGAAPPSNTAPPANKVPPSRKPASAAPPATNPLDALINPAAYAAGITNAKYNPQIAELLHQIALGKAQAGGNQADIEAWYKQLGTLADTAKTTNASAATDALKQYDAAGAAAGHLFGDSGGDPTFHDIQAGNMRSNAEDQAAFDNNMKAILAAAGTQAQTNQQTRDSNANSALASQLVSLRGAKGAEYAANYQTGLQNRTQQEAAQQSLALARALAPAQIAQATASAASAKASASTAAAIAKANLALINANVKKATAQAQASGGWNLNRPNDRGQLTAALRTGLQTKQGGFRIDPISATKNLQQSLVQAGLQNDPQAQAIANSLIQETLNNAHSKHLWGGFAWDGTKVVRSGKHFDPKTGKLVKGQVG